MRTLPEERETSTLWNATPSDAYVGSNNPTDIRAMTKLWGPAHKVYTDGPTPWHVWIVPKSQVKLPRPKSQKRVAIGKAAKAKK